MKMMIMKRKKTLYLMHVHPRTDSCAELVLAKIYYFIDISLKKGVRGVMFLTFFQNKSRLYCTKIHYLIKD